MKAKPFKAARVPNLVGKGPDCEITRAQLVALIAARVPSDKNDDDTSVRNRISTKITYDVSRDKLKPQKSKNFSLRNIAEWTAKNWPGLFDDVLQVPERVGELYLRSPAAMLFAEGRGLPASREAAHAELDALHQRLATCSQALGAARAEIADLAPKAAKWDHFMATRPGKAKKT